jgi:hypothetical protein
MIEFLTDAKFLLIFFGILLLIFRILLIHVFKLGKIAWKRVEYVWLAFASVALLSAPGEVRRWIAEHQIYQATQRTVSAFGELSRTVRTEDPHYICVKYGDEKTQQQYDEACTWYKKVAESLPRPVEFRKVKDFSPDEVDRDYPKLQDPEPPNGLDDTMLVGSIRRVGMLFRDYNDCRLTLVNLLAETKRNEFEEWLFALAPLLLCIELAIRITKVSGEIRLEKKESRS